MQSSYCGFYYYKIFDGLYLSKLVCVSKAANLLCLGMINWFRETRFCSLFNVPLAHIVVFPPFYLWVGKVIHEGLDLSPFFFLPKLKCESLFEELSFFSIWDISYFHFLGVWNHSQNFLIVLPGVIFCWNYFKYIWKF